MKKNQLPLVGFALIMCAFLYLIVKLTVADVPLNLATWSLWVIIDSLLLVAALAAAKKEGSGKPWIMIGFEIGACTIASIAIFKAFTGSGQFAWGFTENLTVVSAFIAVVVWKLTSTANSGVVSITIAMYVAMIPTWVDQWQDPTGQDPWFWLACSIGAGLEFYARPKKIASAFLPGCAMVANGFAAILCFAQFL
jgi:hypothetical protein